MISKRASLKDFKPKDLNSDLPGKLGCRGKMSRARLDKLQRLCSERKGKFLHEDESQGICDYELSSSQDKFARNGYKMKNLRFYNSSINDGASLLNDVSEGMHGRN